MRNYYIGKVCCKLPMGFWSSILYKKKVQGSNWILKKKSLLQFTVIYKKINIDFMYSEKKPQALLFVNLKI
jgi:hypothetical protein